MNPPEDVRIEFVDELLDWLVDQGFGVGRRDQRIFAISLEVTDPGDRNLWRAALEIPSPCLRRRAMAAAL